MKPALNITELNFQESVLQKRIWELEHLQRMKAEYYQESSCCIGIYLVGSTPHKRHAIMPLLYSASVGSHLEYLGKVRTLQEKDLCKLKRIHRRPKRAFRALQNRPSRERLLELLCIEKRR